jgi:hypothetical protein
VGIDLPMEAPVPMGAPVDGASVADCTGKLGGIDVPGFSTETGFDGVAEGVGVAGVVGVA